MVRTLRQTLTEFSQDECPRLAAALAYYAVFSLPALLVLVVAIAGMVADGEQVGRRLTTFFQESLGAEGAEQIDTMLREASQNGRGWWATAVGGVVLLAGATGVLGELQTALNRIWGVQPADERGGLGGLVMTLGGWLRSWSPQWISSGVLQGLDVVGSLLVIALLFAAMLKFFPDVKLWWHDVWPGALLSAVLFTLGKYALSVYLSWSNVTSAYGAAGSLALVMLWIYYSAMIFLLGAEFTQVLTAERGRRLDPEPGSQVADSPKSSRGAG
jgi:membrane protein